MASPSIPTSSPIESGWNDLLASVVVFAPLSGAVCALLAYAYTIISPLNAFLFGTAGVASFICFNFVVHELCHAFFPADVQEIMTLVLNWLNAIVSTFLTTLFCYAVGFAVPVTATVTLMTIYVCVGIPMILIALVINQY